MAILPEICLIFLAVIVMALDLIWKRQKREQLSWVVFFGLLITLGIGFIFSQPGKEPQLLWGGMLRFDSAAFIFRMIFLTGAAITTLFTNGIEKISKSGEYYVLLLISTLGMCLMASASDLIMLYLAIATTSIPLYVLSGFLVDDRKAVEA
jgi:NADH-quinone oxidoreductase subunit N